MPDVRARRRRERRQNPPTTTPVLVPGASVWIVMWVGAFLGGIAGLSAFKIMIYGMGYERASALPVLAFWAIFVAVMGLGGYAGSVVAAYLWQVFKRHRKRAR